MAKVRITSLGNNAKQLNWPVNPGMLAKPDVEVNKTLKPVPREDANLEAEKGETAVADMTGSGIPQQYNIAGKPHSQGGTPLNLPGKSFIFSKDADMKIKDEKIQKMFGMTPSKSGYTPAEIAKKYDLNKYHKVLGDDDTDDLQKETAEMMIGQYNMKLAKLALVQESLKGFPQGIPAIAEPYVTAGIINPEELAMTQSQQEIPGGTEMRYGGPVKRKVRIVALPKAGDGKSVPTREELAAMMSEHAKRQGQKSGQFTGMQKLNNQFDEGAFRVLTQGLQGLSDYKKWGKDNAAKISQWFLETDKNNESRYDKLQDPFTGAVSFISPAMAEYLPVNMVKNFMFNTAAKAYDANDAEIKNIENVKKLAQKMATAKMFEGALMKDPQLMKKALAVANAKKTQTSGLNTPKSLAKEITAKEYEAMYRKDPNSVVEIDKLIDSGKMKYIE